MLPFHSVTVPRSISDSSLQSTSRRSIVKGPERISEGMDRRESLLDPMEENHNAKPARSNSIASMSSKSSGRHGRISLVQPIQKDNNHTNPHAIGRQSHVPKSQNSRSSVDDRSGRIFVQARYDFVKTDPSALSFQTGDVIQVFGRLDSGWWDGQLDGVRGWFPSNFVEIIETDLALELQYAQSQSSEMGSTSISHPFDISNSEVDMALGDHVNVDIENDDGNFGWGDLASRHLGNEDLDDLARQVMSSADEEDDNLGFQAVAAERRKRQEMQQQHVLESMNQLGIADLGPEDADEFGILPRGRTSKRTRQDTERTMTLKPSPMSPGDPVKESRVDNDDDRFQDAETGNGHAESAWEPNLTPDGQVYYHNTITGEDSWHLPPTTPSVDKEFDDDDNDFFNTFTASSSAAFGNLSSAIETPKSADGTFRLPPQLQKDDLPYPWITKMSDDGREWLYFNRNTGQETRERPSADLRSHRLSSGSSNLHPTRPSRPRQRASVDLRRKRVAEWCERTRREFKGILTWPQLQNMAWYVDMAQDALQEVRECAMQGGEAEEEISRATDTFSEAAAMEARQRRNDARGMLKAAHDEYKQALRNLLTAFGYVGPMDGINEMQRPKWADERTMLGIQGMLASSVHAVLHSNRPSDGAANVWQALTRDVNKCQDILGSFPALVTPHASADIQHHVMGKRTTVQIGFEKAGTIMSGRWGFGTMEDSQSLKVLDEAIIRELRTIKELFKRVPTTVESALDLARVASKFKLLLLDIDIASAVDVDGDVSDRTPTEFARAYQELVIRAGNALLDLEEATASIDELCILCLHVTKEGIIDTRERLVSWIELCLNAVAALWVASTDQKALSERGNMLDQIGHRSPRFHTQIPRSRPQSIMSNVSRFSRGSIDRSRVKGLDEEFLDSNDTTDDVEAEKRDRAGALVSASTNGSQSSLALQVQQQQARKGDTGAMSATSSTTSLGYGQAESDGGSLRSKRTSLMKFMKGRSSNDDDGRSTARNKKKLAKIFGEDEITIPTSGSPSTASYATVPPPPPLLAPPEPPWYLSEDYLPEEISLDEKGSVKAGTLNALIARLTPHGSTDTAFFQAFLLTFRSFTTGRELIELLIRRYHIEPPEGLNDAQSLEWKKMKQTPIRLRVSNTIRSWLDVHYLEAEDADILDRIEEFASTTLLDNGSELLSRQLVSLVNRRRQGEGDTQRRIVSGGQLSPPAPLVPRVALGRSLKLTDVNPIELARQLTILEFQYFQAIKPIECLNKVWQDNENKHLAPNVRQVIRLANLLSSWTASHILAVKDLKSRAGIMKYFIQTAMELRNLNNFSSMASVMAGLNSAPVLRLKRTKELLSAKTNAQKAELDKMLDSTKNFQNYKDMLKTINPPCVPFFGFWLSALVFIEDGNKDYIQPQNARIGMTNSASNASLASSQKSQPHQEPTGPTLINFFKRSLTSEILRDIQQYQSQPYNLARCKPVYEWLYKQLEVAEKGNTQADMQELYEVSLALEPREREEERITRMLHDSVSPRIMLGPPL